MATFSKDIVFNVVGGTDLISDVVGQANVVFGKGASLSSSRGRNRIGYNYNIAVGTSSTTETTDVDYSLITGYNSGNSTISATALIVQGLSAGSRMSNVRDSILFGIESGVNHTTAKNNIFLGFEAGSNSSPFSGNSCNIGIGYRTFTDASLNKWNVALGTESLYSTENVHESIFIGNMLSDMSNVSYCVTLGNKTGRLFQGSNMVLVGHNISCAADVPLYINDLVAIGNSLSISRNLRKNILIGTGDTRMFITDTSENIIGFGNPRSETLSGNPPEPTALILNGVVTQPTFGRMLLSFDYIIPNKPVVFFARSFPNRRVFVTNHVSTDLRKNISSELYNTEQILINLTPNRIGICGTFLVEGSKLSETFTTDYINRYSIHKYKQTYVFNPQGYTPQQIGMMAMSNPNIFTDLQQVLYVRNPIIRVGPNISDYTFKGGVSNYIIGPGANQLPISGVSSGDMYINFTSLSPPMTSPPTLPKILFYIFTGTSWISQEVGKFGRTDTFDTISFERRSVPPDPPIPFITRDTSELYLPIQTMSGIPFARTNISEVLYISNISSIVRQQIVTNLFNGLISGPCGGLAFVVQDGLHLLQISRTGISWVQIWGPSQLLEENPPDDVSGGSRDQVDLYDILPEERFKAHDVFAVGANTILQTNASFSSWTTLSFASNTVSPIYNIVPTGNLSL